MNIKTLIELLNTYNLELNIDCIHFDENSHEDLCIDVYDNETGESCIRFYPPEDLC